MDSHFAVAYTAIEQRRHALAAEALAGVDRRHAIVRRDVQGPTPRLRAAIARALARLAVRLRSLAPSPSVRQDRGTPATPNVGHSG
jgi:hypothetical protein